VAERIATHISLLIAEDEYEEAFASLNSAVGSHEDEEPWLVSMAYVALQLGKRTIALDLCRKALARDPDSARAALMGHVSELLIARYDRTPPTFIYKRHLVSNGSPQQTAYTAIANEIEHSLLETARKYSREREVNDISLDTDGDDSADPLGIVRKVGSLYARSRQWLLPTASECRNLGCDLIPSLHVPQK